MMKTERTSIAGIPALILGEPAERVWLFVHGKLGSKEEAAAFAETVCPMGVQVVGIDLPEHGDRSADAEKLLPWQVIPELRAVYRAMESRWQSIALRANSIGAWLSMLALGERAVSRALLVSPIVDMEDLIRRMMTWAGVTEEELAQRGEIPTDFGETLSWEYLTWVREHPVAWNVPTEILYGEKDHMVPRTVMEAFAAAEGRHLTVMEQGEHWFHTEEQLRFLRNWEAEALCTQ